MEHSPKFKPHISQSSSRRRRTSTDSKRSRVRVLEKPYLPKPPPQSDKTTRSSPTLFEMMASKPEMAQPRAQIHQNDVGSASGRKTHVGFVQDKQALMMQRVSHLLMGNQSPGNQFNNPSISDIKLTLSSKDGFSVSMNVHRQILVAHSRFFAVKMSEMWVKQQRTAPSSSPPYNVEIADCDDVEVYIEALMLMYCKDLMRNRLFFFPPQREPESLDFLS
ncbi:hypothetical protein ACFX10_009931 [Malus domestica]